MEQLKDFEEAELKVVSFSKDTIATSGGCDGDCPSHECINCNG